MPRAKKLSPSVRKDLARGVQLPQAAELVGHFMVHAGGPRGVAKMLMDEYNAAREGSIVRQRILDAVLRMLSLANDQLGTVDEVDLLATEDLERELDRIVGEIPEGVDGQEEDRGAGPGHPEGAGRQAGPQGQGPAAAAAAGPA